MKALVTGANGFTGSYLTKHLLAKGYDVRVLVRKASNLETLKGLDVEYFYGDLGKDENVYGAAEGIDVVFHIAALFRAEDVPKSAFWDVNLEGTRKMLEEAKRAGVKRFVHCSTVGVQGEIDNPPATEDAPYKPGDYYQESKMDGEKYALEFFKRENLPGTVVRPVGIYGPGDDRFLKIFKFIHNGKFRMIGNGKVLYHLTFVEDLVAGIALAGEREEALGEIFTIGGEGYLTLGELVAKIATILKRDVPKTKIPVWPVWTAGLLCEIVCRPIGIAPPIYRRRVDFFIKDRAFDISKAKKLLGYQPKIALEDGLTRTASWYAEKGWL
ncbi:MAG: NAD-dependent epimerase/dehydratase family protein [Deferribacteres bacterium]|nr:NAD-dependent epimerase/dehydratase family protein [candidate division KSB1 bacterium]MCB9503351.1 NAD-dependent epimerase/dehydratase family protein [Deferribacteres bacterium]